MCFLVPGGEAAIATTGLGKVNELCLCVCLVTELCPTLCNPMDCSLPAFQARILEWVAISFFREIFPT